jgi:DNA-binding NarL/FixJ family response regulator
MSVLVVDADPGSRFNFRTYLSSLGFGKVVDAPDHLAGLAKLEGMPITHIIFDAKQTTTTARDFLMKALEFDPHIVSIPSSSNPTVDDIFNLLIIGARGYLVKPFTEYSLDDALVLATKGDPISESILFAKNRNEALVSLVLGSLDRLATVRRQAEQFETARRELPRRDSAFRKSAEIARTFAEGGIEQLLEAMINFCEERANGPATRLGRIREKLRDTKIHPSTRPEEEAPPPSE